MPTISRADRALLAVSCLLYTGSAQWLLLIILALRNSLSVGMIDAGTWDRWSAVFRWILRPTGLGQVTIILLAIGACGLILTIRGLRQCFGKPRVTTGRIMIAVLIAAIGFAYVPLGILLLVYAPVVLTVIGILRSPASADTSGQRDERGMGR